MGTFLIEHWSIILPTAITGMYLLRHMHQLIKQQKPEPILVPIKKD